MARIPGIDVSRWQEEINWPMVAAAGYRFAGIRATVGNRYTDPRFYGNWAEEKAAGLLVTAYHVLKPGHSATSQIDHFFNVLGERDADLPLVLDVEVADEKEPGEITSVLRECLTLIEVAEERKPMIYTAAWFWNEHVIQSTAWSAHDLWVANYGVNRPLLPNGWDTWTIWQYSETGEVPGITRPADLDYFAGSYADLLAYANPGMVEMPEPVVGLKARVVVPVLNVRNGPGLNYADVGDLEAGDVVNITGLSGDEIWIEFEPGKWAAFRFDGQALMEIVQAPAG